MTKKSTPQDSQLLSLGRRLFGIFIGVLVIIYALTNAASGQNGTGSTNSGQSGSSTSNTASQPAHLGKQTKSSNCVAVDGVQDKACTPGAIFPDVTAKEICVPGYSASVRNVPVALKDDVYAEYGITSHFTGQYEVDHLISLELGGSNDIANLWPEAAEPKPGFHQKDAVENYLHQQVCSGLMTLQKAQALIASDWHQAYDQMPVARAESLNGEPEATECPEGCG